MIHANIARRLFLISIAVAISVPGCVERKETIHVQRDGRVDFDVEISGDVSDFTGGDALPESGGKWALQDKLDESNADKPKQTRTARLRVAKGEKLPDSFADPADPLYDVALRFPTELTIERRKDGTYYNFRRVYEPREFARYEIYKEALDLAGVTKDFEGKDISELSDEQALKLLTVLRALEAFKYAEYVEAGTEALADDWPQHYGLILRQIVLDHFEQVDLVPLLAMMRDPDSAVRNSAIESLGDDLIAKIVPLLTQQLREWRVPRGEIDAFFEAYDQEQARYDVTMDLNDETWQVRIAMPGEIVAHNADKIEDGFATWEFPGKMLMDREEVLMVTSRVGPRTAPRERRPR